jgi:hypothetical protein
LPRRYAPHWRSLADDDLRALWLALERARYS